MTPKAPSQSVEQNQAFRAMKEKVEILNGDRGDRRKSAMREGDAQDLREFIANLRKGTADVQKDLADAVSLLDQLGENIATISGSLDETKADVEATTQALGTAQQLLSQLQLSLSTVQSSIVDAQASIDALDQSGAAVAADLSALKAGAGSVTIPPVTSAPVSAPPTASEHNALLDEVIAQRDALIALKAAVAS